MSYVAYTGFLRSVLPFCNGVPQAVAIDAIRNAAIEFCEETMWLQYTPAAVNGVAGTASYTFAYPSDTIVSRIIDAWYDTYPLAPVSEETLAATYGLDWRTMTGAPIYYLVTDDPTKIVLVPTPSVSGTADLKCLAALRPSRDSLTIDGNLYEWWLEVIAHGAKAALMATPQQAYTNMTAAGVSAQKFRDGIFKAKADRNRGGHRATLVMRPPQFV